MSLFDRIHSNDISSENIVSRINVLKTDKRDVVIDDIETIIRKKVIEELKNMTISDLENKENIEKIEMAIKKIANLEFEETEIVLSKNEKEKIITNIINIMTGYGPITSLINDENITEVMVNGPDEVYIEKNGSIYESNIKFKTTEHLLNVIDRIVSRIGRRVDESSPMVDARLPDGSRVNVVIPPLSLKGPILTIRKFSKEPFTVEDLINFKTLTSETGYFLKACVEAKANILISGGTGSGKTTTLNVISSFIPENERIITIEDAAELRLWQKHIIPLESRPNNSENKGAVTIRDLVRNALRMRPDRIVVGEVRSSEALDMLQAMNTGHEGSLTTGHANSPRDMLSRLETMVLMAGFELPLKAIREQISSAIDFIIHQDRLRDGTRRVVSITEVIGMEADTIVMQDIYKFVQKDIVDEKIVGRLEPTGIIPKFYDKFKIYGIELDKDIFQNY